MPQLSDKEKSTSQKSFGDRGFSCPQFLRKGAFSEPSEIYSIGITILQKHGCNQRYPKLFACTHAPHRRWSFALILTLCVHWFYSFHESVAEDWDFQDQGRIQGDALCSGTLLVMVKRGSEGRYQVVQGPTEVVAVSKEHCFRIITGRTDFEDETLDRLIENDEDESVASDIIKEKDVRPKGDDQVDEARVKLLAEMVEKLGLEYSSG